MEEKIKIINNTEKDNKESEEELKERVEEKVGVGVDDLDREDLEELDELLP